MEERPTAQNMGFQNSIRLLTIIIWSTKLQVLKKPYVHLLYIMHNEYISVTMQLLVKISVMLKFHST